MDSRDAPKYASSSSPWERSCRSPLGSVVFSLRGEGPEELCRATIYASLGLPSDELEKEHALLLRTSPRSWELLDIETPDQHRNQGHATRLMGGILHWLRQNFPDSPALFARDVSGISKLYSHWGFTNEDADFPHVYVRSTLLPLKSTSQAESC